MTFPRKQIPFQTEPVPVYGQAVAVAEGVMRITAQNPGVMTYHGTNTYLVRAAERLLLVDPGPALDAHIAAVLACASRDFGLAVTDILLTHGHHDHIGACAVLRAATGAPVYGAATAPLSDHVRVDHPLHEGMAIGSLTALATPG